MCVQYIIQLLEALVVRRTAPDETYRKLDMMLTGLVEQLRLSSKQVIALVFQVHDQMMPIKHFHSYTT